MLSRVRWQLTAWYVAVLLVVIAAVSGVAYVVLTRALEDEVDDSLRSSASNLVGQLEAVGELPALSPNGAISPSPDRIPGVEGDRSNDRDDEDNDDYEEHEGEDDDEGLEYFRGLGSDVLYLVLTPDGTVVLNPLNVTTGTLVDPDAVSEALRDGESWRTHDGAGGSIRTLYARAEHDGEALAVVEVGRSLESHERQLNDLLRVMLATGAGGLALATAGGFLLAGRALRPTRDAMQKQRQFVADASHELRTPLTLIRASAEAVQRSQSAPLEPEDRASLDDIVTEVDRMSLLVEDLLLLAKLDEGRLDLIKKEVSASGLVQDAVRHAMILAAGKPLEIEGGTVEAGTITCDLDRVSQVLRILLDNAVRHTPQGGRIEVGVQARGSNVEFWVQDSGQGIPEADLPHVFERFYRVEMSRGREDGGSGLGLSIARRLVEAHGGQIEARNTSGGARLSFTLPR